MRQEHRAGEKLFVDYAGQTVQVYDHYYSVPYPLIGQKDRCTHYRHHH
jgi:hypothetical protein